MSTTLSRSESRAGDLPGTERGVAFGCDYNPEQWSPEVWPEDVRLMREAGISIVAINVFGWALIEPRPGEFDFSGLDEVVRLLAENGIGINFGTGTASPPPWLTTLHPEILPMAADGTRRWPGGRQAYCPSSPVFREYAKRLAVAVATRYGQHPAVRMWHVSNELGCHNALCYCDVSAEAFREWLQRRYGSIDALNEAWGTTFWSQRYSRWEDVLPPRATLSVGNPTQALDFARFSSDEVLECYLVEEKAIRDLTEAPVTTNLMVTAHIRTQNYWDWTGHVDIVANDHYLDHRLDTPHRELAFSADLTRGLAGGRPWMLMEQATGAVNWQPRNLSKAPGEMLRNSLTHVARGADSICFFQWRASAQGTEKFHSGLLPHAGTDSHKWREVLELGDVLGNFAEVVGSRVVADVAILFSWESQWAADFDSRPTQDVRYLDQVHASYRALWDAGITADVVRPGSDLSGYRFVIVPALYLVRDSEAEIISRFVEEGGTALITFFSGIVDEDDRVRLGGYPGAFRDLLGVRTDEFFPLDAGEVVLLDDGSHASIWTERVESRGAEIIASFLDGPVRGHPAVTRNAFGDGNAWYVACGLEPAGLGDVLVAAARDAGVVVPAERGLDVETVLRRSDAADYLFIINHGEASIVREAEGVDLVTGATAAGRIEIPSGAVRVIRLAGDRATDG